jgi:hypothetical protein
MPAHRLLQVGRVTMRIGDDQNVHARNKGWIPACAEKHPSYGNKVLGGMTEGKWE